MDDFCYLCRLKIFPGLTDCIGFLAASEGRGGKLFLNE